MKRLLVAMVTVGVIALSAPAYSANNDVKLTDDGGVASLRGHVPLSETNKSEDMKRFPRDTQPLDRNYVQQPPMIPHTIRHYQVNLQANKCLSCHSFKNAGEMGATKISVTHFETREGSTLSDVSPRRYFCLQCHVPQADAKPLVENGFQPVKSLR